MEAQQRTEDTEEYNSFQNRKLSHPTSDLETLVHLVKGSLGSGILAMPLAFLNAGLVLGFLGTFTVGAICTYCIHILVKSAHALCERQRVPSMDFADIAEAAFLTGPQCLHRWSSLARTIVNVFLITELLGCCCVYVVLISEDMRHLVNFYSPNTVDLRLYMIGLLPLLLLMNAFGTNLKYLTPFSLISNVLIGVGLGIMFYYVFIDLPSPQERSMVVTWTKWPMFFGTAVFALEPIDVVMSLENNMKTPAHFTGCPGILNIGMLIITVLYACVGFGGYLKYGEFVKGSITLNLPQHEVLAQSVKLLIAIGMVLTYSLQFYVGMEIVWKGIVDRFGPKNLVLEHIARVLVISGTVLVAVAVPDLDGVMSLIGAVCLTTLGLIGPAIIDLVTFYESPGLGRFNWRLWKNLFLICFGILGFSSGTYVSIKEIVTTLKYYYTTS